MPLRALPQLNIEESARLAGRWSWAERRLYEAVGAWASSCTAPGVRVYFDACSQHHAWRSSMWHARLPGRLVQAYPGPAGPQPPEGLVGPADDRAEGVLAAMRALGSDLERVAVYSRAVLPRCSVAYRRLRASCTPVADRPVARALDLVLADLRPDWEEGASLLVGLLEAPGAPAHGGAPELAATAVARVEGLMLGEALGPGA